MNFFAFFVENGGRRVQQINSCFKSGNKFTIQSMQIVTENYY